MSLTTVFGMGTGVPSSPLTRTYFSFPEKKSKQKKSEFATRRTDAFALLTFRLFEGLYPQN